MDQLPLAKCVEQSNQSVAFSETLFIGEVTSRLPFESRSAAVVRMLQ